MEERVKWLIQHQMTKCLDFPKLKAFADDGLNGTQKLTLVLRRVEDVVGKGENAGCQHFLLYQQCFQKHSSPEW